MKISLLARNLALCLGILVLSGQFLLAGEPQSSINIGMSLFKQASDGFSNSSGQFLHFQVENHGRWLRPTYGAFVESSSGNNTLLDGQMLGGFTLVADTAQYVKPFLGLNGAFGWAFLRPGTPGDTSYIGLIYGFHFTAGAEIRLSKKETATALRIQTGWRYLMGQVGGGITGKNLNSVLFSLGLTF
jgi:hypothetical protein